MKFTCSRDTLIGAINTVQKAVSSKTTLPILEGILIEAENNHLKLTSNDLEIAIECVIEADVTVEGSTVIMSKMLGDVVRKLTDDEIFIEMCDNSIVNIDTRFSHFEIKCINPQGFPKVMEIEKEQSFTISQNILKEMIKETVFAVSDDDSRPIFKGVYVECKDDNVNFVATDGFKLAMVTKNENASEREFSCIIPGKTLNEVAKIIKDDESKVTMYFSSNQLMFVSDNCKIVARLIEGEYLNYRVMIPKDFKTTVNIKLKELLSSIERASLVMNDEKKSPLNFLIDNDNIIITANAELGSSKEVVSCESFGERLEIRFNSRNILDTLKVIGDEEIKMSYTTNMGPCVIEPKDGNSFVYLVMPLKFRNEG